MVRTEIWKRALNSKDWMINYIHVWYFKYCLSNDPKKKANSYKQRAITQISGSKELSY
jgi:hypothetical protein